MKIIIWVGGRDACDEGEHLQVLTKEAATENFHLALQILGVNGVGRIHQKRKICDENVF